MVDMDVSVDGIVEASSLKLSWRKNLIVDGEN
jgi:hypothetical protein